MVQLLHFRPIAVEQIQQAGLRSGSAAAAQEADAGKHEIHLFHVGKDVLEPEGRSLAHRYGLGGLIMGIAQGRQAAIAFGKDGQVGGQLQKLLPKIPQRIPVQDQIGVVCHITARSPQVDDTCSLRCNDAIGIDMGHHVVANFLFPLCRQLEINVLHMGFQGRHLLGCDRQPQRMLGSGQLRPQSAPGLNTGPLGEQALHLL